MARRHSFFTDLQRVARAAARAQREAEAAQRRRVRDQLRNEREVIRLRQKQSQVERQEYLAARQAQTERQNIELESQIESLRTILGSRQTPRQGTVLACLTPKHDPPRLLIPSALAAPHSQPVHITFTAAVKPMAWWEKLFGRRSRFEREIASAEENFRVAVQQHAEEEAGRAMKIEALQAAHEQETRAYQEDYDRRHLQFQDFVARLGSGDTEAVATYIEVVLDQSPYPDNFPQEFRVAYDSAAKQLIIDYELPTVSIVPATAEYRYVKTKDVTEEKPRKAADTREIYRGVIAAVALRCIHECFAADSAGLVDVLTFSGFVNSLDPATGNQIRPYVISVRISRERFAEISLDHIDTKACLRNLGAQVSPQPAELVAVKPIIEFDMVDKRFIGERDVLSEIDSRPNLMDLSPAEFEALVGNLFTKMGLETKLTRTSRDGGVDAIAYDTRPILGGKVVIQAKRYSHTVGVSAVRDLYGTMMNEGANKGILVATSSYGPDAYDFCKDKPIELVDGSGLLYHLEQVGVRARIIFPEDRSPIA